MQQSVSAAVAKRVKQMKKAENVTSVVMCYLASVLTSPTVHWLVEMMRHALLWPDCGVWTWAAQKTAMDLFSELRLKS